MAVRKTRRFTKNKTSQVEPKTWKLHCYCKRPESASWTVTCANCGKWYHGECISFPEELQPRIEKLFCRRCQTHLKLSSVIRPKCRLASCIRPVADGSEYCSKEHCDEFWKSTVEQLDNTSNQNTHILKWLAERCGDDYGTFIQATPNNLPKAPKPPNAEQKRRIERLDRAIERREANNTCSFDARILDDIRKPLSEDLQPWDLETHGEVCQGDMKNCSKHQNWPEMAAKRLSLASLDHEERQTPDPAWLAKRAKYLVAGTTRFSRRKGWKAAYFVPYVWDDGDRDFFLDNNPEPFWDKNF